MAREAAANATPARARAAAAHAFHACAGAGAGPGRKGCCLAGTGNGPVAWAQDKIRRLLGLENCALRVFVNCRIPTRFLIKRGTDGDRAVC